MKKIEDGNPDFVEEAVPTVGEKWNTFWMKPKPVDPDYAARITSFPAVLIGIGLCFSMMFLLSAVMV